MIEDNYKTAARLIATTEEQTKLPVRIDWGRDAKEFLIWALDAYVMDGIQVMDFGGINDLAKFIKTLTKIDKYDEVTSIIIMKNSLMSTNQNYTPNYQ